MDRAEATGLGVALAGHGLLLAILSLGFATATTKKPILSEPVEVSFVEEAAPQSTAPTPSDAEPAARLAEIEGPVEEAPPPPQVERTPVPPAPAPPPPKPVVQRQQPLAPAPTPKPVAQRPQPAKPSPPQAKPAPAKAAPAAPAKAAARPAARPTGRLSGLLTGISDRETESRATTPPARAAGPAVQASLAAEIRRQLKPHWKAPTGADVELLRTQVTATLAPNGSVASIGEVRTTGETPSNRSQVKLHQEQAVRAVRLAAPFNLPADLYEAWKVIRPTFDRRLSQ